MSIAASPEPSSNLPVILAYRHHSDSGFGPILVAFFGILLPLMALLVELKEHIWAGFLMDPIPRWWHVAAILTVPVSCGWTWWSLNRPTPLSRALFQMNAFALGVAIAYTIGFFPTLPLALIGCLFWGLGFLPLSPVFAIIALLRSRGAMDRRMQSESIPKQSPTTWPSGVLAFLLLGFAVFHHFLTASLVQKGTSENALESKRAISLLRWIGAERTMLEACYGDIGRTELMKGWRIDAERAREVYYRGTGSPFSDKPIPASASNRMLGGGRWNFDPSLGQDRVANHVPDLFLTESRMDVQVNAAAATAYSEWTLVFRNDALNASEARALVELPPGGVVSRLTLWINGEPREAAFGGRGQVRAAYQEVAVTQRRDPVLVTTAGLDRVLMQCFPVPPRGGEMKVRMGITAPLSIAAADTGSLVLPRFVEENFESGRELKHHVSAEGDAAVGFGSPSATKVMLAVENAAFRRGQSVAVARANAPPVVFAEHPSDGALAIRQTLAPAKAERPSRVVFVVDGSKPAGASIGNIGEMLAELPAAMPFTIVFAGDNAEALDLLPSNPHSRAAATKWIDSMRFTGGQDNIPALVRAWDIASAEQDAAIVWLHAPQPVILSALSPLDQRMERAGIHAPLIFLAPLTAGPNRIAEKLDAYRGLRDLRAITLAELLRSWAGKSSALMLVRDTIPTGDIPLDAVRTDRHVTRLWALDEVRRLAANADGAAAQKLAVAAQIVTPVSGAVVLETQAQYDRHGLSPVDPASVPIIPEPGSAVLLLGGAVCVALRRFRKREPRVA